MEDIHRFNRTNQWMAQVENGNFAQTPKTLTRQVHNISHDKWVERRAYVLHVCVNSAYH